MKALVVMNAFKGSLSPIEACLAVKEGLTNMGIKTDLCPASDGGDGFLDSLSFANKGEIIEISCLNPLGKEIRAKYLINKDYAFIETSLYSGLALLEEAEYDVMNASTFGSGQVLNEVLNKGIKNIYIGLGGSATNDAGVGLLRALGFIFLDENGKEVGFGGKDLERIKAIDLKRVNPKIYDVNFMLVCDVYNPFYGENGAAYVYAKQKGASSEEVELLDKGLKNFADVIKRETHIDLNNLKGSAAAGGMAGGLYSLLNAKIIKGSESFIAMNNIEKRIEEADVVITGEGKIDFQTPLGKIPGVIGKIAYKENKRVIFLCGIKEEEKLDKKIYNEIYDILPLAKNKEDSIINAKKYIKEIINKKI